MYMLLPHFNNYFSMKNIKTLTVKVDTPVSPLA